jgi:hypothetical protein
MDFQEFETHLLSLCHTNWSLTEMLGLTVLNSLKLLVVKYQSKVKANNFRNKPAIEKYFIFYLQSPPNIL